MRIFKSVALLLSAALAHADLRTLATLDGASANEGALVEFLKTTIGGRQELDNTGSLTAVFGSGRPHTLLIAGLDEPGYVVSAITADGYLRVHRLSATPPHHNFDTFFLAQPVRVTTAKGKILNGVVSAFSVHLQTERFSSPRADHPEQMYVDIGARSEREARQAGVDLLDPITLEKPFTELGERVSAAWISSRAGAAVLVELARRMRQSPPAGTVTLAFVTQQHSGHAGLARVLARVASDQTVWIKPGGNVKPAVAPVNDRRPQMADKLAALAAKQKFDVDRDTAGRLNFPAFANEDIFPQPGRITSLTLGVENPGTPVEAVSLPTLGKIADLLAELAGAPAASSSLVSTPPTDPPPTSTLEALSEVYGVSTREAPVRKAIEDLLPSWARRLSRVDKKGNLIVELGVKPERLFLSHMDELGFEVIEIQDDGKLRAESRGGGTPEFFEWHAGLVHTESKSLPALILGSRGGGLNHRVEVDIGAASAEQAAAMGVKLGTMVTVRKQVRTLLGTRAASRSFDDRIGCAVLVDALRSLKREEIKTPTWFVFTVEEEIGLRGAEFLAESVRPREVFALDTFVSSDSPLESPRIAGARLGEGFVIRAIDSAGITPRAAVLRVAELARRNGVKAQYGVTSGANDGSKFVTGGAINIPLGWPLRYSHSPSEVVDLADVDALARIVRLLVRE